MTNGKPSKRMKLENNSNQSNSNINNNNNNNHKRENKSKQISYHSSQNLVSKLFNSQVNGKFIGGRSGLIQENIKTNGFAYSANLVGHWGCVNALSFSNRDGYHLISGSDDKRVLLWEVFANPDKQGPIKSFRGHRSNIFSTVFSHSNRYIVSCGNDETILRYDVEHSPNGSATNSNNNNSVNALNKFSHTGAVYRVSMIPGSDELFLSASEDGNVCLWDSRTPETPQGILSMNSAFECVDCHPDGNRFLSTNLDKGVELWDLRKCFQSKPTRLLRYFTFDFLDVTSALFNRSGSHLVCTIRKFSPAIYSVDNKDPLVSYTHNNYKNRCTMKSAIFAGENDEYIISGSDDYKLYIWNTPSTFLIDQEYCKWAESTIKKQKKEKQNISEEISSKMKGRFVYLQPKTTQILSGYRSIVNNVKYHPNYPLLATSGVEKTIKMWSTYPLSSLSQSSPTSPNIPEFTAIDYASLFNDNFITDIDEEENNTEESNRTLALFDFFNRYDEAYGTSSDEVDNSDAESDDSDNDSSIDEEEVEFVTKFDDISDVE